MEHVAISNITCKYIHITHQHSTWVARLFTQSRWHISHRVINWRAPEFEHKSAHSEMCSRHAHACQLACVYGAFDAYLIITIKDGALWNMYLIECFSVSIHKCDYSHFGGCAFFSLDPRASIETSHTTLPLSFSFALWFHFDRRNFIESNHSKLQFIFQHDINLGGSQREREI